MASIVIFNLCCVLLILSAIGADGLCCQSREFKEWHGCRSTKGVTKGKTVQNVTQMIRNVTLLHETKETTQRWVSYLASSGLFHFPGKYYYEVSCHDQGLCRIGWSSSLAALDLGTEASPCRPRGRII